VQLRVREQSETAEKVRHGPLSRSSARLPANVRVGSILQLQRTAGNAAVNALLLQRAPEDDWIHKPLIDDFRRRQGLPPGGRDEQGNAVGPSDAEIKYGMGDRTTTVTGAAPPSRSLTREQARALVGRPLPPQVTVNPVPAPARRFFGRVANDPHQGGLDLSLDTSMSFQVAGVLRHLDGTRFRAGAVIGDFLHEPTFNLAISLDPRPGQLGTIVGAAALTALNLHFTAGQGKDLVELAVGQLGVGLDSRGNPVAQVGAQAEVHSNDEHFSIFINTAGTLSTDASGVTSFTWNPVTFGLLWHIVNP
jgi:hypothetical protein